MHEDLILALRLNQRFSHTELVNAFARLTELARDADTFAIKAIPLSVDAYEEFERFRQFTHKNKQAYDGREREWWAKGDTHVLRLAGTLSFFNWSRKGGSEPEKIELEFVQSAVRLWRDYFWPHTRAALRQIGISDRHANARCILNWLRAQRKQEVSREDIRRDALGQRLNAQETDGVIASLENAGWLRNLRAKSGPQGGRPVRRWQVNPLLFNPAAETAETYKNGGTYVS